LKMLRRAVREEIPRLNNLRKLKRIRKLRKMRKSILKKRKRRKFRKPLRLKLLMSGVLYLKPRRRRVKENDRKCIHDVMYCDI